MSDRPEKIISIEEIIELEELNQEEDLLQIAELEEQEEEHVYNTNYKPYAFEEYMSLIKKKYGIDIHITTQIGYGLYIGHGGPLVVNPSAIIGNNVNLSQFTTIGANGGRQAAEIGDNVYIGPQVCIIDHVKIGANATIGAGSVVTKDIPEGATAAGNYAKVLNMNNPGGLVNRRWTDL